MIGWTQVRVKCNWLFSQIVHGNFSPGYVYLCQCFYDEVVLLAGLRVRLMT